MSKVICPFCGVNTFAGRKCRKCSQHVPSLGLEEETEEFQPEEILEPTIEYPEDVEEDTIEEEITFEEDE